MGGPNSLTNSNRFNSMSQTNVNNIVMGQIDFHFHLAMAKPILDFKYSS